MHHFYSNQFTWKGNRGVAYLSDLLKDKDIKVITQFTITSTRTDDARLYEIDSQAAKDNDYWDGEMMQYTDNLWDGTLVTIINN